MRITYQHLFIIEFCTNEKFQSPCEYFDCTKILIPNAIENIDIKEIDELMLL